MSKRKAASCALCDSPLRSAAASMKALGAGVDEIAASCGLSIGDVQRHFDECLAPRAANDDAPALGGTDEELRGLLRDSEESYHSANLAGNSAAVASALNVRLRVLTALGAREQLRHAEQSECRCDPKEPQSWCAKHSAFVLAYLTFLGEEQAAMEKKIEAQREVERKCAEETAKLCATFTKPNGVIQ